MPLENLKCLRNDMKSNGWIIDVFDFVYKKQGYFVIVELYREGEIKPGYALCKLKFIKKADPDHVLCAPANSNGIMIDAKPLREYFGIEYAPNLGNILSQFSETLGKSIPDKRSDSKSQEQVSVLVNALSRSDSEDPSKIYCFKLRRNPRRSNGTPSQRSMFNDNKARLLRPALYSYFKDDKTISFCFTSEQALERSDAEIIEGFSSLGNFTPRLNS